MQCPECRSDNPADARFCNKCGSKLEISCPKCSKTNPPDSNFCNGCGNQMGEIEPSHVLLTEIQKQFQNWGILTWQLLFEKALPAIKGN